MNRIQTIKTFILISFLVLGSHFSSFGQSSLDGMKYQAILRDASGNVIGNSSVDIKFTIYRKGQPLAYVETHSGIQTNQLGLINLEIGLGTATTGDFKTIDWDLGKVSPYYILVELDLKDGNGFNQIGESKLLTVPYAQYAKFAESAVNVDDADADPNNEIQDLSLSGNDLTITQNGTPTIINLAPYLDNTDAQVLSFNQSNDSLKLTNGGSIYLGNYALDAEFKSHLARYQIDSTSIKLRLKSLGDSLATAYDSLGNYNTRINTNAGAISNNTSAISSNATQITADSIRINTNTANITTNAGNISNNSTAITTSATQITADSIRINTNTTNITTNAGNISNNSTRISTDSTRISSLELRDTSSTNELNTGVALNVSSLEVTDAGGTKSADLSVFRDTAAINVNKQAIIDTAASLRATVVSDTVRIFNLEQQVAAGAYKDSSSTNELNTGVALNVSSLEVTDAGGTKSADLSVFRDTAAINVNKQAIIDTAASLRATVVSDTARIFNLEQQVAAGAYKDSSSTNELNTGVALNVSSLEVTDAGGTKSADLSVFRDTAAININKQAIIDTATSLRATVVSDTARIYNLEQQVAAGAYKDSSSTNELNTGVALNVSSLEVTDAGGTKSTDLSVFRDTAAINVNKQAIIDTAASLRATVVSDTARIYNLEQQVAAGAYKDSSSTNEIQALSISNDTINLTNGGFVVLPAAVVNLDNDSTNEKITSITMLNDTTFNFDENGRITTLSLAALGGKVYTNRDSIDAVVSNLADSVTSLRTIDSALNIYRVLDSIQFTKDIDSLKQVAYLDTSATNEIQVLTMSNDTIYLSNGGFVVLPATAVNLDNDSTNEKITSITMLNDTTFTFNENGKVSTLSIAALGGKVYINRDSIQTLNTNIGTLESAVNAGAYKDSSSTNELNTGVALNVSSLEVTDAGGTKSADLSVFRDTAAINVNKQAIIDTATSLRTAITSSTYTTKGIDSVLAAGSDANNDSINNLGNLRIGTNTKVSDEVLTIRSGDQKFGFIHTNGTVELGTWLFNPNGSDPAGGAQIGTNSQHRLDFFTNFSTPQVTLDTTGFFGIGTSAPKFLLDVNGHAEVDSLSINEKYYFPTVDGSANQVLQTNGSGVVTWQTIAGYTTKGIDSVLAAGSDAAGDSIINLGALKFGSSAPNAVIGINSTRDFAIRTLNSNSSSGEKKGVFTEVTGTGSGANFGLYGGASGSTSINYGAFGVATGSSGRKYGIYGTASGGTSANNYAGYFKDGKVYIENKLGIGTETPSNNLEVDVTDSLGIGSFLSAGSKSTGVAVAITAEATGGSGTMNSVAGDFEASGSGDDNYGIAAFAQSGSALNVGVDGSATSGGSSTAIGVSGSADGTGSINYGIYGEATGATTNWAGYFNSGNVYIANNLGIGVSSPTRKLDVGGDAYINELFTDSIIIGPTGNQFGIGKTSGTNGQVLTYNNGVASWTTLTAGSKIADADGNTSIDAEKNANEDILRFTTNGTERMTIAKTGAITTSANLIVGSSNLLYADNINGTGDIRFYQAIFPNANVTEDLGKSGNRWSTIYGKALDLTDAASVKTLVVTDGAAAGKVLTSIDGTGKAQWSTLSTDTSLVLANATRTSWMYPDADTFRLFTNNREYLTVKNGRIGINMSDPTARLCLWDTIDNNVNKFAVNAQVYTKSSADTAMGFRTYLSGDAANKFGVYADVYGGPPSAKYYALWGRSNGLGNNGDFYGTYSVAEGTGTFSEYWGIYAKANGTSGSATNYGIWATASGGTDNFAGYFDNGNVQVNNKMVVGGSFGNSYDSTLNVKGGIKTDYLRIYEGAGLGKVLISDAAGGAAWADVTTIDTLVCPSGYEKVNGSYCISKAEKTAATWFIATTTCSSEDAELASFRDWYVATSTLSLTDETDDAEWVSNVSQNNMMVVGNGAITTRAFKDPTGSAPYRCVYRKH